MMIKKVTNVIVMVCFCRQQGKWQQNTEIQIEKITRTLKAKRYSLLSVQTVWFSFTSCAEQTFSSRSLRTVETKAEPETDTWHFTFRWPPTVEKARESYSTVCLPVCGDSPLHKFNTLYFSLWACVVTCSSAQMASPKNSLHSKQKNPLTGSKNSEPAAKHTQHTFNPQVAIK